MEKVKVILVATLLVTTMTVFSQTENVAASKSAKYGFNLGINYSNLFAKEALPSNASISNNLGFRLGVLADYKISKLISLSPKAELSFNSSTLTFSNPDNSRTTYKVMPIDLDIMAHFVFKKDTEKLSPYFLIGPNVKIPISEKSSNVNIYDTNSDLAIDFGIGFDKPFTYFNFLPELRYSFGLLNINRHPSIESLNFHNLSLVFNFNG